MSEPSNCPAHDSRRPNRRLFLAGAVGGAVVGGVGGWVGHQLAGSRSGVAATSGQVRTAPVVANLGMPGPYPGRVVEVHHPGSLKESSNNGYTERNRDAIKAMIAGGMKELVGAEDAVQAWRALFTVGDRVGIKVVPVGRPDSISSYEVVLEVIDALTTAGVRKNDILVFERYRDEFVNTVYDKILPDGVHWEACSAHYDDPQTEIDGQLPGRSKEDRVAGYDPDVFRELNYCLPAPDHDPKDDRRFRSHLSLIVSSKVDKFISIPVLKDHRSSGVTLALKNLSHGLNNNVSRSHIIWHGRKHGDKGGTLNQCGTFIPALASQLPIRQKGVLQILDGLVGTWEGGPKTTNKTFATWPYKSLFFATDPVALDRVGWEIIDKKRVQEGWPGVAEMGLDARTGVGKVDGQPYPEELHIRQPQHIALAETLGLGVFDVNRIDHCRIKLT